MADLLNLTLRTINHLGTFAYLDQPGTAEGIFTNAFFDFTGMYPDGASIVYWSNAIRSGRWTYDDSVQFFIVAYLGQPGTAEQIARNAYQAK